MGETVLADRRGAASRTPRCFSFRAEREGFAYVFTVEARTVRIAAELALRTAAETWGAGTSVRLLEA